MPVYGVCKQLKCILLNLRNGIRVLQFANKRYIRLNLLIISNLFLWFVPNIFLQYTLHTKCFSWKVYTVQSNWMCLVQIEHYIKIIYIYVDTLFWCEILKNCLKKVYLLVVNIELVLRNSRKINIIYSITNFASIV